MKKLVSLSIAIFFLLTAITPILKAQVNTQDSLILVTLYDSTDGVNWANNANWLTKNPVNTWAGIGVNASNRVDSINLNSNQLTGYIPPSLGNITTLKYLGFSYNNLTGIIPSTFGNLIKLQNLYLQFNQLNGNIPTPLGNLSNLINLSLCYNQLSDTIPFSLGNLVNLQQLYLHYNQLTGKIPISIGNLNKLQYLYLHHNQLSDTIPSSMGKLASVLQLYIYNNKLSGLIPSSLGGMVQAKEILMYDNQLSGAIPSSLSKLTNLNDLQLYGNQLSDSIPSALGNMTNLHYLYLDSNQLSGTIPASLGNIANLSYLYLNNNHLSGSIPASLGNLTKLNYLELNNNQLSGIVPSNLGSQSQLYSLSINNNQLIFNGMEALAKKTIPFSVYAPQSIVPLQRNNTDTTFSITVGGTPANNTYKWYNKGTLVSTKKSDSTYRPTSNGLYYVAATNAIATQLTLNSDTIVINYPTNPQDSLALVDLYNNTGGANWANHTNWLSKLPVSSWYGVTEYNWRVTSISLASNKLIGVIPSSIVNLPYLTNLALNNNQFTFTGLEAIAKKFSFAFYSPQANVSLKQTGTTLSVSVGGNPANNTFKWYRNDTLITTKTSDSTYTPTTNGKYFVVATNAIATKLSLNSDTINITTLPIKNIILTAKENNGQVLLQWQTIGEENALSFIIQRSTDGSSFTEIATQEAVGSGNNGYSYIDTKPLFKGAGGLYYRIKSIDKEGSISFSNVSLLTTNHLPLTTISVFPNPVSHSLTIKGSHISSVKVIDNLGKGVKTVSYHDETNPTMSVSGLSKGIYHLKVQTTDGNVNMVDFEKE